jgi:hypothetical protein
LTSSYGISDILDNIKSGRAKRGIDLRNAHEGEGCPMWEEWQALP